MDFKKMTVKEIRAFLKTIQDEKFNYIDVLSKDSRKTVQRMSDQLIKEKQAILDENDRIQRMWDFENKLVNEKVLVAGIDEVGRGPLAGPVVAAAVILKKNDKILNLKDSKQLKKSDREQLYKEIKNKAVAIGIGIVDHETIDEINILEATKVAMKKAVDDLDQQPEHLLIDALELDGLNIPQHGIIKGDDRSMSIAAASVIAKVTRDRMMYEYHEKYPEYEFNSNVGYGTEAHRKSLKKFGATTIHRKTFIKNLI